MAKEHTHHRRQKALNMLLQGISPSAVVSQMSEQESISRRQAQRYVREGYKQMRLDIESCGVDRASQVSKLVNILETTISLALQHKQCAAAVSAAKELRELLGLAA